MLSSVLSSATRTATSYFYLPIEEEEDKDFIATSSRRITWSPSIPTNKAWAGSKPSPSYYPSHDPSRVVDEVLYHDDLYKILGVTRTSRLDKTTLRRAYLARSRECHPDKFPDNPGATRAFQKVSVAYDVLSQPSSKRAYDTRPTTASYDMFAARPANYADQTFRGVILATLTDFLDGDLEMIRTLLRAANDLNASFNLGEEGIDSVLMTLEAIRQRALTCRTCVLALHSEVCRLLEIQYAFRQLGYFELRRRSSLIIQLARVAVCLPIVVDEAIAEQRMTVNRVSTRDRSSSDSYPQGEGDDMHGDKTPEPAPAMNRPTILPSSMHSLVRALAIGLERMEQVVG